MAEHDAAHPDWTASLLPRPPWSEWESRARAALPGSAIPQVFRECLARTIRRSLTRLSGDRVAVITGDIPAMWLRDSSTQMWPYLTLVAQDPHGALADMLVGVVRRQHELIAHDPYTNAFKVRPGPGGRHRRDRWGSRAADPAVWERKYEIDSLCFPFQLTARLHEVTGRPELLTGAFPAAAAAALRTLRTEQDHEARSDYRFVRPGGGPLNTLPRDGLGTPVGRTGLTWSGFRPSDDATTYGYNIPANLHAAAALGDLAGLCEQVRPATAGGRGWRWRHSRCPRNWLTRSANTAPSRSTDWCGLCLRGGRPWPPIVDGRRQPAKPARAAAPCRGPPRGPALSADAGVRALGRNPTFVRGKVLIGLGSPHTRRGWVWPIALATEGLTCGDRDVQVNLLETLAVTTAGTGHMHESIDADDPGRYTRPWFSWADSMFCQLVMTVVAPDEVVAPGSADKPR